MSKPQTPDHHDRILRFLGDASALKDTFRSARTRNGHFESVAAHSWSLALLALLLEPELRGPDGDPIDFAHLLRLIVVHDLGEAIGGDIPAIHQDPNVSKSAQERADLLTLLAPLPDALAIRLTQLWDEYEAASTPEAQLAKGLDKLETMTQHVSGQQAPDFDYLWNLGYGVDRTEVTPLLRQLRSKVDTLTRAAANAQDKPPRQGR